MISLRNISKSYHRENCEVPIFKSLNFEIEPGAFCAIMGPSGTGKSTFLNLVAGVDAIDSGEYWFNGERIDSYTENQLSKWRANNVSFVFQSFNLLRNLSAAENVELPLLLTGMSGKERKKRVVKALELVNMNHRAEHLPEELSGGQMQRIAIARALITDAELILCDEPTGNIDAEATQEIMDILVLLNQEINKTILMVTHDSYAAKFANNTLLLDSGRFNSI